VRGNLTGGQQVHENVGINHARPWPYRVTTRNGNPITAQNLQNTVLACDASTAACAPRSPRHSSSDTTAPTGQPRSRQSSRGRRATRCVRTSARPRARSTAPRACPRSTPPRPTPTSWLLLGSQPSCLGSGSLSLSGCSPLPRLCRAPLCFLLLCERFGLDILQFLARTFPMPRLKQPLGVFRLTQDLYPEVQEVVCVFDGGRYGLRRTCSQLCGGLPGESLKNEPPCYLLPSLVKTRRSRLHR